MFRNSRYERATLTPFPAPWRRGTTLVCSHLTLTHSKCPPARSSKQSTTTTALPARRTRALPCAPRR
eukprot:581548-Prymnesium_polylepis.1